MNRRRAHQKRDRTGHKDQFPDGQSNASKCTGRNGCGSPTTPTSDSHRRTSPSPGYARGGRPAVHNHRRPSPGSVSGSEQTDTSGGPSLGGGGACRSGAWCRGRARRGPLPGRAPKASTPAAGPPGQAACGGRASASPAPRQRARCELRLPDRGGNHPLRPEPCPAAPPEPH